MALLNLPLEKFRVGSIPAALGSLTNFYYLELDSNRLRGSIPVELSNLANLVSLKICNNYLYTTDADLRAFLDSIAPGWESCQMVDPARSLPGMYLLLDAD